MELPVLDRNDLVLVGLVESDGWEALDITMLAEITVCRARDRMEFDIQVKLGGSLLQPTTEFNILWFEMLAMTTRNRSRMNKDAIGVSGQSATVHACMHKDRARETEEEGRKETPF